MWTLVFGDTCTDTAIITAPAGLTKQLYLTTDGTDNDITGGLDRVDPVNTGGRYDIQLGSAEMVPRPWPSSTAGPILARDLP